MTFQHETEGDNFEEQILYGGAIGDVRGAMRYPIIVLAALAIAGASLPHNNMMPYLTLNFCIALQGVFPPRT